MKRPFEAQPLDELDEYLAGGSELSRAYQREPSPSLPPALERRVLGMSRGSSPCLAPLALAASVLLSVALVLAMLFGPRNGGRPDESLHLVRVAARSDAAGSGSLAERLQYYTAQTAPEPKHWLADIAALRRAGRTREAQAELRRFRAAYPDYPVPGELP